MELLLKCCKEEVVVKWLHSVIQLMWKRGEVAEDWRRAIIVPLHKKDSKLACSNYRGISLLSVLPSKVYAKILDSRLRSRTESMVMEVQGVFESGRSCVNQISIRQLSEKILEKNV